MNNSLDKQKKIKYSYQLAIKKLANREYAASELYSFLKIKGFSMDVINEVLLILSEKGYQSDLRYAEMLVRARFSRKYGPEKIKQELKNKKIKDSIINSVLNEYEDLWIDQLQELFEKKAKQLDLSIRKDQDKLKRYLLAKGYRFEQINTVL